jgi:bifunctional non-homologous end joining protein LigD
VEFVSGVSASKTRGDRRQGALPPCIEPALATCIENVPSVAPLDSRNQVRRLPRPGPPRQRSNQDIHSRGHDWTHRFKKVAHDAWHIKAGSAIIDGEIVVPASNGTTDFSLLQNELRGRSSSIVLVGFDLLYLNGRDLRKLPLFQRKAELKKIIAGTDLQFSESFEIEGRAMFVHASKLGLEGVVSKARQCVRERPWE